MSDTSPRRSFWKRRFGDPVMALLTQGVTPDKVASTVAVGTAASLFPFLGFTTTLNIIIGFWFRMNQPLLQAVNYLLAPLHIVMILVYVRVGEWIWRSSEDPFSIGDLISSFRHDTFREFLHRFGWAGVHAFTAWVISVPFIIAGLYFSLRPLMRKLARLRGPKPA
ncbi:DUF2062 domain-containing protein [Rariglobus hedericola]|uniref:DUF2062 domain-containing protein n=1 Tax=Rariglobus hedericola TaxID=2597822 RepID=A0A556QGJ6_9BACT|nr:DUF2062 domain-containing protein [Rariglobus hedericola]TSJ75747.1 DUF2062 domain-containing protein [Rariglobus hedericola]